MSTAPRPLIAGNWKMNGTRGFARALIADLVERAQGETSLRCDVLICPPATLLETVHDALAGSPIALGAQDCSAERQGAYTGDIAAEQLLDAGCRFVILGHSERRAGHKEDDARVRRKAEAAQSQGLTTIICVGETAAERDAGRAIPVVIGQLAGSLAAGATAANTVIAYEPVWAIGTGRTPTVTEIGEVHGHLRAELTRRLSDGVALRILYGGSVNAKNARDILGVADVNGALVGGASLKAQDFWTIVQGCP